MIKNIFFSLIFLSFAACRVQQPKVDEFVEQRREQARAAAALVGLEDSVEIFFRVQPATPGELQKLPKVDVNDDLIEYFAEKREEVNKQTLFQQWWQELKTVKNMEEYYQVLEKRKSIFEKMDEDERSFYEKSKQDHLTSGKYGLYREKEDSVVRVYELANGIPPDGMPITDK